jgi:hypothetical protein
MLDCRAVLSLLAALVVWGAAAAPARADDLRTIGPLGTQPGAPPTMTRVLQMDATIDARSADSHATLQRVTRWGRGRRRRVADAVEDVCRLPCVASVSSDASYVIGGDGISRSAPFDVPSGSHRLRLDADTASKWPNEVGLGMTLVGVAGLEGGMILLGAGDGETHPGWRKAGLASLLTGLASLGVGIALLLQPSTSVRFENGRAIAASSMPLRFGPTGLVF